MLSIITARIAVGRPPSLCTSCYMLIQSGSALEPLQPRSQVPIKVLNIGPEPFHVSPMAHASVSAWPTVGMDLSREPRGNQPPGAVTSLETDWLQSVSDWLVLWFLWSWCLLVLSCVGYLFRFEVAWGSAGTSGGKSRLWAAW